MAPTWLTVVSWCSLAVAAVVAVAITADIVAGRRQKMAVMNAVWPVTALYLGPIAARWYLRFGRAGVDSQRRPGWAPTAVGVSHCGAGCTLGDIIAETVIFLAGITLAGEALYAEFIGDYLLAVLLGLAFQYFAIVPMRGLGFREGVVAAAKADVLSLTAFEVGLFGWMALMAFVFFPAPHHLRPNSAAYWFLMQVGMGLGFISAYPVNAWLIRRGIKESM